MQNCWRIRSTDDHWWSRLYFTAVQEALFRFRPQRRSHAMYSNIRCSAVVLPPVGTALGREPCCPRQKPAAAAELTLLQRDQFTFTRTKVSKVVCFPSGAWRLRPAPSLQSGRNTAGWGRLGGVMNSSCLELSAGGCWTSTQSQTGSYLNRPSSEHQAGIRSLSQTQSAAPGN